MDIKSLFGNIRKKKSYLCVGLDTDLQKVPKHLREYDRPVFEFNKQIIDATAPLAVAVKPNLAFYESRGLEGWKDLELTASYIRKHYPELFLIADAKRGDIGNTSAMYARAFFEQMDFDAVTVAPYMGEDSVVPFLKYPGKFIILLALTSNQGASDFQYFTSRENKPLFTEVINRSKQWGTTENLMYVVGATKASLLVTIREHIPDHFLLVPGVGAQGGSLEEVAAYGMNKQCGLLVNASRSILYASSGTDFAAAAAGESLLLQKQMETTLRDAGII